MDDDMNPFASTNQTFTVAHITNEKTKLRELLLRIELLYLIMFLYIA